ARLDIEVSKTWLMPDPTPVDQLTQYYSDLDIDPEMRLYCFLEGLMVGFLTIQMLEERKDGTLQAKLDFPVVLPNHEEVTDLLYEKAVEILRRKKVRTILSSFGLWGRSKEWAEKWDYRRINEIGVLYGIEVASMNLMDETENITSFDPATDLDDCVNIFVTEYNLPEEDVKNFTNKLFTNELTLGYYVLREKGEIVATGAIRRNPNVPTLAMLSAVYDKGVNYLQLLLSKLIGVAKKEGIERVLMFFTHLCPDDPIIDKYRELGFTYLGSNVNYAKEIQS
ncbi:MAG: hypothetical protein ACFFCQ_14255, partial [Promethearchaeota archaeon]